MARVVLVGLPGVGKSTVARALAQALQVDVVDTDQRFEELVGVSVPSFLRTHDEAAFRAREYEALVDALTGDVIVATGGGVVTTAPARAALREQRTVWLDCPDDILLHRVASGDRPLLGGDAAAALLQLRSERGPWYRDVASARVDASQSVEAIVNDVVALLKDEVQ